MIILLAILSLLPFVAFPLLAAAATGHLPQRLPPARRALLLLAVMLWASFHAYVRSEDKPEPPEPPEPPPGPYIPGGEWECVLRRDPFSGEAERRWEYRLPPSHPDVPVESQQP